MSDPSFLPWKQLPLVEWANRVRPVWALAKLEPWDAVLEPSSGVFTSAFRTRSRSMVRSVDLRQVVGHQGLLAADSWLEALNAAVDEGSEDMRRALEMADAAPTYYLRGLVGSKIRLTSFDGRSWYVHAGIHEVMAAKFLHAYYEESTGRHPLLHDVPTVEHCILDSMLTSYSALERLVEQLDLPIDTRVRAGTLLMSDGATEYFSSPRVEVTDGRLCPQDPARYCARVLEARTFEAYARWVIGSGGLLRWRDRARYEVTRRLHADADIFTLILH